MEVFLKVKPVKVDYLCTKCGIGYMRPTGQCYPMNPPIYPHKCNFCDWTETFQKIYPYIDYK